MNTSSSHFNVYSPVVWSCCLPKCILPAFLDLWSSCLLIWKKKWACQHLFTIVNLFVNLFPNKIQILHWLTLRNFTPAFLHFGGSRGRGGGLLAIHSGRQYCTMLTKILYIIIIEKIVKCHMFHSKTWISNDKNYHCSPPLLPQNNVEL